MTGSVALVYHNLSLMLDAGVPMLRALKTVGSGSDPRLRRALEELAQAVSKGNTMTETMAQKPRVFDPLDVTIIQAAESSGSLPESLALLAKWHEFCQRIRRKLLSGLMLPIALIHLTAFIAPLPALFLGGWHTTGYLTEVVKILLLFYIPAGIIYVILQLTPRTGPLRRLLDRLVLKIPVLGRAVYRIALSRFCWVFHMLLKAGVPITDCARKAALATANAVVTDQVKGGAASAESGNPVVEGFSVRLPAEFLEIWQVGEQTGMLEDVSKRLADNNADNADFLFTEFASWLPRLVYFLVSLLIIYHIFKNFSLIAGVAP